MKTFISAFVLLLAIGCASDRTPDYLENDEMQRQEEDSRTGKSDELGSGFDYGTTSSPN